MTTLETLKNLYAISSNRWSSYPLLDAPAKSKKLVKDFTPEWNLSTKSKVDRSGKVYWRQTHIDIDNNHQGDKREHKLTEIQESNAHQTSIFLTITLSRFCLLYFGKGSRTCLVNTEAKCFLITEQL